MIDLEERFGPARELDPPELWTDVERRARGPSIVMPDLDAASRGGGHQRLVAAVVAFAVFALGGSLTWQAFRPTPGPVTDDGNGPPALVVSFAPSEGDIPDVTATVSFGDASTQMVFRSRPVFGVYEPVAHEELPEFMPGAPAGAPIVFDSSGIDVEVLAGDAEDWPEAAGFTPVTRVPPAPGEHMLVFQARYGDAIAELAFRLVVVPAGSVRLVLTPVDAPSSGAAPRATAYVDGVSFEGFMSERTFGAGDVFVGSTPRVPDFDGMPPISVEEPFELSVAGSGADAAAGGLADAFEDAPAHLPWDLLDGPVEVADAAGDHLLAVEATWREGKLGWDGNGTLDRARFFFPIRITDVPDEDGPNQQVSPTSAPPPEGSSAPSVDVERVDLVGTSWRLSNLDGRETPFAGIRPVVLRFGERHLSVKGACNGFGGRWDVVQGQIDIVGSFFGTLIGCSPDVTAIDDRLHAILSGAPAIGNGAQTELRLVSEVADGVAVFERIDHDDPDDVSTALDCLPSERTTFVHGSNTYLLPALPSYIEVNVEGIERNDELVMISGSAVGGEESVWRVVRDGLVIAVVNVPLLDGWACQGHGVGGV